MRLVFTFMQNNRVIFALVLAGTLVRLVYGIYTQPWMGSADQLAWGLVLEEMVKNGSWSYRQLIHYPHEGGSLFMSLAALVIQPLHLGFPPLSIVVLLVDTGSRFIQLTITRRIWGATTAHWFGVWTIFSIPLLLPWGMAYMGLHSLSSFWPFVFIYVLWRLPNHVHQPLYAGLVTGLAISWSYNNLVFIPFYVLVTLVYTQGYLRKLRYIGLFLGVSWVVLLPHIGLRLWADNGFVLQQAGKFAIRDSGVVLELDHWNMARLWEVVVHSIPVFFRLYFPGGISLGAQKLMIWVFLGFGLVLAGWRQGKQNPAIYMAMAMVGIFLVLYAASPFYQELQVPVHAVSARHLSYIFPLIMVVLVYGYCRKGRWYKWILAACIGLGGVSVFQYGGVQGLEKPVPYKSVGWVLSAKFGNEPAQLMKLVAVADTIQRVPMLEGIGWGLAAQTLNHAPANDSIHIHQLVNLVAQFPQEDYRTLTEGVHFAFCAGVTPVLQPGLEAKYNDALIEHGIRFE